VLVDVIVRAAVVYVFVSLVLRALGKRELGELTAFELVLLFVIGDLVQQSITQSDTSVTAAILAISTIALLILAQSYAVFRWKRTRSVLEGEPIVIVHQGRIVGPAIRRQRMTEEDIKESAREQGIADLSNVRVAILENHGKISFLTADGGGQPPSADEHSTAL
jgi:uncharacterized membrane protein YcaP (DUF421 family)